MKFKELLGTVKARLPENQQIILLYAAIVVPLYSWALYWFFDYVPSLIESMEFWESLIILAYVLATSLVESLLILGFMLFWAMLLPARFFREKFSIQGSLIVWAIFGLAYAAQKGIQTIYRWSLREYAIHMSIILLVFTLLVVFVPRFLVYRFKFIDKTLSAFVDRLTIFLYLYLPVSVVGLIVVIIRNIFWFS
jgi:hypothetical protein